LPRFRKVHRTANVNVVGHSDPNPLDAFKIGQRVQLHPDTDTAVGDRWGEVVTVGDKYVHVLLDVSGHLRVFRPDELLPPSTASKAASGERR
jgi:hypothetical protein